jgi:hypothetical protein
MDDLYVLSGGRLVILHRPLASVFVLQNGYLLDVHDNLHLTLCL